MSIDIAICQRPFHRKPMPLEVILGDSLQYGSFQIDHLLPGTLGESEFIAYDPAQIGRGFSVTWSPQETKRIGLRLPQPSTARELRAFYACVERIVTHWSGKLIVEGRPVPLQAFLSGLNRETAFNRQALAQLCQQVLTKERGPLTLYSTMWPLALGEAEAEAFQHDPEAYAAWLHERQAVNAQYASPRFFSLDSGLLGAYFLEPGTSYLLPCQPRVPFGTVDEGGNALSCGQWHAVLCPQEGGEPLGELPYQAFLERVPRDKLLRYDGDKFQLLSLSLPEFQALAASR